MEQEIIRAMEGDADAFAEAVGRLSDQMYKTGWSILKSDADVADAVQDTILTAYEKLDSLKNARHFRTWIMRILMNECYMILRKEKPFVHSNEELIRSFPDEMDGFKGMRFYELLEMADEKYHLILTLYYADGYTVAEIGEMLAMNVNTVKTRLARGRDEIRRKINA